MKRKEYAGGPVPRYLMLGSTLFLTIFGLLMIYSASSISAYVKFDTSFHFLIPQAISVVIGVALAVVAAR